MTGRRVLVAVLGLLALGPRAEAIDPRQRTDTGQFTIYSEDVGLRRQVATFATQTKEQVLALLGEKDGWQRPIVVTLERGAPRVARQPPVEVRVVDGDVGMKIEIAVRIGDDPAEINLQKHLVRAVLLEYMYRQHGVQAGATYAEPPWWLVDGAVNLFRQRTAGLGSDFFRRLIETNKLPPIERFLAGKPDELGPTALAMDHALAMCLLQLLVEQPSGRKHLAAFLRGWPQGDGDSVKALTRDFPEFTDGAPALQKWWTLNLARYAAADRHEPLTAEQTDREVAALLEFEVPIDKDSPARRFAIQDFADYLKLPASRAVLATQHGALVALSPRANALLRPIVAEYEEAFALLARGKTRGLRERLEKADHLRAAILQRVSEIADYLNWFEASQMGGRSNAFDSYLKTANDFAEQDKKRSDPIARYLDQLEQQY